MSTKIYNGYISKLSIEQLLKKFVPLVPIFEEKKKELYYKSLAEESTFKIDAEAYKSKKLESDRQYKILHEIHDNNEKAIKRAISTHTREANDFSANCCVFPMGKNKTLILFYCEDRTLAEMWDNLHFIAEYHYQDQTDQPENISNKDWGQRKRDWDKAVGWGTARERGYCFQFTIERLPWARTSECVKHIPSTKVRALNLLHDNFIDADVKKQREKYEKIPITFPNKKEELNMFTLFRTAKDKWFEYKKTPFKKDMAQVSKNLVKINFEQSPATKMKEISKAIKKFEQVK